MLKVILNKYVDQQVELGVYSSKSRKVRGEKDGRRNAAAIPIEVDYQSM